MFEGVQVLVEAETGGTGWLARAWIVEGVRVLVEAEVEAGVARAGWRGQGVQVLVEAEAEVAWLAGVGLVGESVWVWWQTLRI